MTAAPGAAARDADRHTRPAAANSLPARRSRKDGGARRSHRARRRVLLALAAVIALLVAYVGGTFLQVWQASHHDGARTAGAAIVLGAAQYNGKASPVLRNRLEHALSLYQRRLVPLIVVTGGRRTGDRFTEATVGYNYLRGHGVPDGAILKEVQGRTTRESLMSAARFLRAKGVNDVVLISGPAQSKRLAELASSVGLDAAISPSGGQPSLRQLLRETVAVSIGRVIGYHRMEQLER